MGVQWRDSYKIGIEEIDIQHKELVDAANKLLDACLNANGKSEIHNMVAFLENYVIEHFSMEEKLQQRYSYPDYVSHKKQHDDFIKEFGELKKQIDTVGSTVTVITQINQKVVRWLLNHIKITDKLLGDYLKQKASINEILAIK